MVSSKLSTTNLAKPFIGLAYIVRLGLRA